MDACGEVGVDAHIQVCSMGRPEARQAASALPVLRLPEDLPGGAREFTAPSSGSAEHQYSATQGAHRTH